MKKKSGSQKKSDFQRIHIIYRGRVQGVGFRFNTEQTALQHSLTGWVRNLPNGSVEVLAEGKNSDIEAFMDSLQLKMGRFIQKTKKDWQEYSGEFVDFQIEYLI